MFHASLLLIATYIFLDDASQEFRLYLDDVNKFKILIPPGAPKYLFFHGIPSKWIISFKYIDLATLYIYDCMFGSFQIGKWAVGKAMG